MKISYHALLAVVLIAIFPSCSKRNPEQTLSDECQQLDAMASAEGEPAVFLAIRNRRPDILNHQLKNLAKDPETENSGGQTPLHFAAEEGDVDSMKILLAAGARPKVADGYGNLVIHSAAEGGYVEAMRLLLEAGETVDEQTVELKKSRVVGMRGSRSQGQLGNLLRSSGVNPVNGSYPIHLAARRGNVAMVRFLLSKGADPESKDNNGGTILDYARQEGPLVDCGDAERGNRLGVVRIFLPEQPAEKPDEDISPEELQRRFFGK